MKQYDLNLLTALDALLAERSVSRAATRLGIGQPAMSAALARLRILFGDPILVRGGRGMQPTPRALALADPLRATLTGIAAMLEPGDSFDPSNATRILRMSGGDYAGMTILPGLARRLARYAPGMDLQFRYLEKDSALMALDEGSLDLALLVMDDLSPRFGSEVLIKETFVGAARPDHAVFVGALDLQRFASFNHLLITERGDTTGCVDAALARQGLSRRVAMTVPSAALVADVLRATDLVATIPRRAGEWLAATDRVRLFALPIEMPGWAMRTVWATRNANDPALAWLREQLLDVAAAA